MDGSLSFENGRIWDFLELVGRNLVEGENKSLPFGISRALGFLLRTYHQLNPAHRSRRNVAHHYDLSGELYELFLDADRQYSCAYFARPDMTLEEAQTAKKRHIARKLMLCPGDTVLDIGCGWGGMALTLAEMADVQVLGVTLSQEQLAVARSRAEKAGVSERVRFELMDYRHVEGSFDRIVSVGMFEHVGAPHYREFFETVERLLKKDGVALLHTIGRNDPPGITSPFIRKYIFPGGYIPALSEVAQRIERTGLFMTDVEILRLHYAETLKHWRHRFLENWERAKEIYDERFCRMWEFYLAGSEMSFRYDTMVNFQIQLTRRNDVLPLTRDYLYTDPPQDRNHPAKAEKSLGEGPPKKSRQTA
jgi:cyclopropane-fatty-acyl-phospholipid synthase